MLSPLKLLSLTLLALAFSQFSLPSALAQKAVPPGFKVELLYKVPDIEHPSVVTCDDEGNLFIGEDPMDMRGPTTKHFDRIIYVKFDKKTGEAKKTVFAENLSAVFGMIWRDGALYVMHAPLYSVFRDTDGDDKADERKDLAKGFGPDAGVFGFNDHIVTGTKLGIDNRVYVSVGDKGIPKATGADGSTVTLEGGGVVRMKIDGTQLENFTSGTRNHLDVAMDPLDNIFTYDNTDDGLGWWTRYTHHVPTGYYGYPYDYHPHPERHLPRISEHGGGSPVGAACYNEAAWPEKYRGAAFHCEWGKGNVQVFFPTKKGATFDAKMEDFLVKEGPEEFRPLDLCFSPDGKYMYLADWNFGGWTDKKVCGRVFRISYVGGDVAAEPARTTNDADIDAQIKSLGHPAQSERMRAQHKLAMLGDAAAEPLTKLLKDAKSSKWQRIHAIWTQSEMLDRGVKLVPEAEWCRAMAKDVDPDVRAQAARACGLHRAEFAIQDLIKALKDSDASVRMHASIALGRIGSKKGAAALYSTLDDSDPFARHTRVQALRALGAWKEATEYLKSPNKEIRLNTILAMTGQYHVDVVQALSDVVNKHPDVETRVKALEALSEVCYKADPYVKGWWGTQPAKGKPSRSKIHTWDGTTIASSALQNGLISDRSELIAAAFKSLRDSKEPSVVSTAYLLARRRNLPVNLRIDAFDLVAANDVLNRDGILRNWLVVEDSEPLVLKALQVIEAEKIKAFLPDVKEQIEKSKDTATQVAALSALVSIEGERAADDLSKVIKSLDLPRRKAAISVAEKYRIRGTIPALLEISADTKLDAEITQAMSAMPDKRALGLYLQGVTSKNSVLRDASREALVTLKGSIGDEIITRHKRNELSPDMRRELQAVFAAPTVIRDWQLIGAWTAEPKLDFANPPKLNEPLKIGEKEARWKGVRGNPEGRVSPAQHVQATDGAWVVGYATVEAAVDHQAEFLLGSDDQAVLWINGKRLFQFTGNRGWTAGSDKGKADLKKGTNHIYFLCGNTSGPWDFSLSLRMHNPDYAYLFENVPAALDIAVYREHATKNAGSAERGRAIFTDLKGVGCVKCHAVKGEGAKIGPDLVGIGTKYPREELIRSVLEPSNRVAESYMLTNIVTADGKVLAGIVQSENETELELADVAGKITKLKKTDIEDRQKSSVSLMPNGLKDGMTPADFADVIAYLESLKQ